MILKVAEKKVQIEEIRETYENQMHRIKNHKVKEEETGEYLKKLKQQFKEVIEKVSKENKASQLTQKIQIEKKSQKIEKREEKH